MRAVSKGGLLLWWVRCSVAGQLELKLNTLTAALQATGS